MKQIIKIRQIDLKTGKEIEIDEEIEIIEPTEEEILNKKINEAKQVKLTTKRAEARALI